MNTTHETNPSPEPPDSRALMRSIVAEWQETGHADTLAALNRYPQLKLDHSIVLELAYEEFVVRTEAGEELDPDEYADGFPEHRSSLRSVLAAHRLINEHPTVLQASPTFDWPAPGDELLGYCIRRQLGRGAFARVYLAQHEITGQRRVLKVTTADLREVRLMAELDHPNVAPVYDARVVDTMLVAVMPYHGSATLHDLLDTVYHPDGTGPTSQRIREALTRGAEPDEFPNPRRYLDGLSGRFDHAVATIGLHVARGLEYLHNHKIWHRDLKPSNIVLAFDGRPVIVDFNLSVDPSSALKNAGGTVPYMAPEHVLAALGRGPASAVNARSDIFSLGVILYELLTGQHPFGAPQARRSLSRRVQPHEFAEWMLGQQRADRFNPRQHNPAIDPVLSRLVMRCLANDPSERPASAAALARELERILASRHWRRLALVATVTGLLFAGGTLWAMVTTPPPYETAVTAFGANDYNEALEQLNEAVRRNPEDANAYFLRGATRLRKLRTHLRHLPVFEREEQFLTAELDFQKAEALGRRDGHLDLARAYCAVINRNEYDFALIRLDELEKAGFSSAPLYCNRAACKLRKSKYGFDRALIDAERAVALDPSLAAAYDVRARCYAWRYRFHSERNPEDLKRAISDVRLAIEKGSESAHLRKMGAEWLLLQPTLTASDCQLALTWMQEAVERGINPEVFQKTHWIGPVSADPRFAAILAMPPRAEIPDNTTLFADPLVDFIP